MSLENEPDESTEGEYWDELPERWRGDPEGFERWLERTGFYEAG